jgi:small subunit ribosomal protein S8
MPHSNIKETIARVLVDNHFVDSVNVEKDTVGKLLTVVINTPESNSRISSIDRVSTPGRRVYAACESIPKIKQGRGIIVISTSHGVMTGEQAKAKKLGGELICTVS